MTDDGGASWTSVVATTRGSVSGETCPYEKTSESYNPEQGRYLAEITAIDSAARTLQFDPVEHLVGAEAAAAFERDHPGDTSDFYDINASPQTHTAPVSDAVRIRLVRFGDTGDASVKPDLVSFDALATYLADRRFRDPASNSLSFFSYWASIRHSQVVDICEQYHP